MNRRMLVIWCFALLILGVKVIKDNSFLPITRKFPIQTTIKIISVNQHICRDLETNNLYRFKRLDSAKTHDVYNVKGFLNPPAPERNPGTFSEYEFYKRKKIYANLTIQKSSFIIQDQSVYSKIVEFIQNRITTLYSQLPSPYFEIFTGLIIGDKTVKMPHKLKLQFKNTGLIHLIVVSGAQVSLLTGLLVFLCHHLRINGVFRLALLITTSILFYFITGGGPSILRAVLMNTIALLMSYSCFRTHIVIKLLFLFVVHLFISSDILYDIGAQLSYITTISMIFIVPLVADKLTKAYGFRLFVSEALSLALSPFLLTTPILLFHFHSVSLIALFSNLIIPPLLEGLVVVGMLVTPISLFIPWISIPFLKGSEVLIRIMLWMMDYLDHLFFSTLYIRDFSLFYAVLAYVVIYVFLFESFRKGFLFFIPIALCLCIGSLISPTPFLECVVLDVGQGDATVIITPQKKVILIDTGPHTLYSYPAKDTILPFLRFHGVNHIDLLVVTHYDQDHSGGLSYLEESIPITLIIDNSSLKKLLQHEFDTKNANRNTRLQLEKDVALEFLNEEYSSEKSENNNSLVCKLVYKNFDMLFTGDLEREGEFFLVNTYRSNLKSDIYKVGHHGSKTSSTFSFLQQVQPSLSIISAGKHNRYGHPAKSVMDRLKEFHSIILQTSEQGAVLIKTDGDRCYYRTWLENELATLL